MLGGFLSAHGKTLLQLQRFEDAEKAFTEGLGILEAGRGRDHERTIRVIKSLGDLHTAWHSAEPGAGHDAKAEEWRARLPKEDSSR